MFFWFLCFCHLYSKITSLIIPYTSNSVQICQRTTQWSQTVLACCHVYLRDQVKKYCAYMYTPNLRAYVTG